MGKALLLFALVFAGASVARGQGFLYHCAGEIYVGPVRSARIETAQYVKVDGQLVEGPRRLVNTTVYSDDRRRAEHTSYDASGKVRAVYVRSCYEDGRQSEYAVFDGERRLVWRQLYSRDGREVFKYNADGRLMERQVTLLEENGQRQLGHETYDGEGRLIRRAINTREDGKSVWATYDGEGRLLEKAVHTLNYGGAHHSEYFKYNPDGTVASQRVARSDAATRQLESEETGRGGAPIRKLSERREYDAHRNLVKLINYRHDPATGELAPATVSYHEITYF